MIRILAIACARLSPSLLNPSCPYANSRGLITRLPLLRYRQFNRNLCTPLSAFRTTVHLEFAAEQCYPLAHTRYPERLSFCQGFWYVKSDPVILHGQLQHSIGGSQGNVYV